MLGGGLESQPVREAVRTPGDTTPRERGSGLEMSNRCDFGDCVLTIRLKRDLRGPSPVSNRGMVVTAKLFQLAGPLGV